MPEKFSKESAVERNKAGGEGGGFEVAMPEFINQVESLNLGRLTAMWLVYAATKSSGAEGDLSWINWDSMKKEAENLGVQQREIALIYENLQKLPSNQKGYIRYRSQKELTNEELGVEDFDDYGFVRLTKDTIDPENPKATYKKGYTVHQSYADQLGADYESGIITNSHGLTKEEVMAIKQGRDVPPQPYQERE